MPKYDYKYFTYFNVVDTRFHNVNLDPIRKYNGEIVEFVYDLHIRRGGRAFTNYWMQVECPFAEKIKKELNIVDSENYLGLHITICNNKSIRPASTCCKDIC